MMQGQQNINLETARLQGNISEVFENSVCMQTIFQCLLIMPEDWKRRFESTCLLNVLFEKKKIPTNSVRR
jgi:hypothetical protein